MTQTDSELHAIARKAHLQLGASVFFFLVFIGWELAEIFVFHERSVLTIVPVALAFLSLPRRIPVGDPGERPGENAELAGRLAKLRSFCTWLRVAYFVTVVLLVFVLPRILPPPT